MNRLKKLQNRLDKLQQKHTTLGFIYAVIWKYGDDHTGYLAALLTYYGFLSLFPLLLVVTTVTDILSPIYPNLQETVSNSVASYFPLIGQQLAEHIHSLHQSGWALVVALLVALYGARGVASAFRYGVNLVWSTPKAQRLHFPKSSINNIAIIVVGGVGLIFAAAATAAVVAFDSSTAFRIFSLCVDGFILFWVIIALLRISLAQRFSIKKVWLGICFAAVGLVLLQTVGGLVLARQLKHLDALYSYFAVSLGLLFWIYLQAQVVYFAIEIASVQSGRLWPRNFDGEIVNKA